MTPQEAKTALDATTRDIIACKKIGRRQHGTPHKGPNCRWPAPDLERLAVLKAQAAAFRKVIDGTRAYRMPHGVCAFCDEHERDKMMPGHSASTLCQSGKRDHCTCDTCF